LFKVAANFSLKLNNFRKVFIVLFLLGGVLLPQDIYGQTGGRKREGRTSKRGKLSLKRTKSAGHADEFARSKGRKNIFSRIFRRDQQSWDNRPTGNKKSNWRENKFLFSRHRSQGVIDNSVYQDRQNAKRARKRDRGNASFSSKKHQRK